jgi:pseudouridine kinase
MYSHLLPLEEVVNATGAGDAFMAMILYAKMNQFTVEKALEYACGAGMAAVMSEDTINRNISLELIEEILKERRV